MGKTQHSDRWPASKSEPTRSREETLHTIKVALVTAAGLGADAPAGGSDPYDSKLGTAPRDVWTGRGRG